MLLIDFCHTPRGFLNLRKAEFKFVVGAFIARLRFTRLFFAVKILVNCTENHVESLLNCFAHFLGGMKSMIKVIGVLHSTEFFVNLLRWCLLFDLCDLCTWNEVFFLELNLFYLAHC